MLKAVIFDLDGLLVNSTPIHKEANTIFLESMDRVKLPSTGGREGMRMIDIIREYKDIYDLPGTLDELYQKRQDIFLKLIREKLKLMAGSIELLKKLKARNLKIGLATSGDQDYVRAVFAKFPVFKNYFDKAVTSEDVQRGKPNPDCYRKMLGKLEVKASDAVVLEDSMHGITSAKAAGISVICIPNKNYPDADYSGADKIFPSLLDVDQAIL